MRRPVATIALVAALALAAEAAASLQPIRRDFGEASLPRVRSGHVEAPPGHGAGRVRVIVRLAGAPLAAWESRRLAALGIERRLDVREPSARLYLRSLALQQSAAAAAILQTIPSATVEHHFAVLLNGLAVDLPVRSLARLRSLAVVTRVYPSLRYTLRLDKSPGVIGATAFSTTTGARGNGVKIAIVDDGVDPESPFLAPAGFSYPPGFPLGDTRFTTPKVIVARSWSAPGTPARSKLAFDADHSFHATHVAGIAAGNAGVTAPRGTDHPETRGLSGVAPRAWIGNYRVFSLPTPVGDVANTPEIVAAFEAAVADGMDVINFSGGGAQTEPANDALVEVIANVTAAGVVAVIAAGNDRDDFGAGTVGSPGTAPDAIAVAAVSNTHVFSPVLAAEGFREIPYQGAGGSLPPGAWATTTRELVDVASITGTDGRPVDRYLCGPVRDPNGTGSTLPSGSLDGAVALVSRGLCTFVSKAARAKAAGAVGLAIVDNRSGEANQVPIELEIPALMIADLDGADLRAYLASRGGRAPMRAGRQVEEIETGRSGVVTSFSSSGPAAFGHTLKPDVAAPGGAVLSSSRPALSSSPFAVFDGTSMATPHVSGAAALLVERHPGWSPAQVKSALTSTAVPAWADTARTVEAPVSLAGGGLISVDRADDPRIFTSPSSLSFGDLDVSVTARSRTLAVSLVDAGGGAGEWSVEVAPQSAPSGTVVFAPRSVTVPGAIAVTAIAAANAVTGDAYGFVVLRRDGVERRLPYLLLVRRPGLRLARAKGLARFQTGSTKGEPSLASTYRFPDAPFGPPPAYGSAAVNEAGSEDVYVKSLDRPSVNFGVAVESESAGAEIDPFVLGSLDEGDVQGLAGLPVNVNSLMDTYALPNGAAAAMFPKVARFYVSVDSALDEFTGASKAGGYVLRSWVDDLEPPTVTLETVRVAKRRPLLAARIVDDGSGVDPLTLVVSYGGNLVGASDFDPIDGLALFPIPAEASPLKVGKTAVTISASDYQESKNVQSFGTDIFPNTAFVKATIEVDPKRIAVSWLLPGANDCAGKRADLVVAAEGPRKIERVRFLDGGRLIGVDRKGEGGVFSVSWRTAKAAVGKHTLTAETLDSKGRTESATRAVRVCSR